MVEENYEKVLEKISRISGLDKEELERRVEAKRAKLAGLISREGAAQVIAAELGINFDNEKVKINELLPGMRKVNVVGKVINLFPVRTFERNGKENKVVNFFMADDTSNIKVVLWDTNHIDLIEKGDVKEGVVVEISNASIRDNEIHLGSFSEFKLSKEVLDNVKTEKIVKEKNIFDFRVGESSKTRAFVVQVFQPKFFNVCSQCKKKVTLEGDAFNCQEHGKVVPEKRYLLNVVLDDGTDTIRAVAFNEAADKFGLKISSEEEMIPPEQRENFIGKEMVFTGDIRNNKYFNTPELIIENVQEIDLDSVISELQK